MAYLPRAGCCVVAVALIIATVAPKPSSRDTRHLRTIPPNAFTNSERSTLAESRFIRSDDVSSNINLDETGKEYMRKKFTHNFCYDGALLSQITYDNRLCSAKNSKEENARFDRVQQELSKRGLIHIHTQSPGGEELTLWTIHINLKERAVYVTFRGSHVPLDWLIDIAPGRTYIDDVKVQASMHNVIADGNRKNDTLKKIEDVIAQVMIKFNGKLKTLIFCGHSLGGAYALFAAAYFTGSPIRFHGTRASFSNKNG
mmetsp:Transcript_19880/g.48681  ORF Transcript_19880/g.48681 Transcript_19880/m.48681 type:complete len:257 (-) Transcript_19880:758-1528(-)